MATRQRDGSSSRSEVELTILQEALRDRRSRRRDRERDARLTRVERWVHLGLFVLVLLTLIYLMLHCTHSVPLAGIALLVGVPGIRRAKPH